MKILMYTVININGSFGSGLHVKKIAEKLTARGHDLILFAPSFKGKKKDFKFHVIYLAPKGNGEIVIKIFQDIMAVVKLIILICEGWKPDIVYSRFGLSTILLPIICRILNINYITEVNGSHLKDTQNKKITEWFVPFLLSIERLNYLCSNKIVTVSNELADFVKQISCVNKKKVITIPNGVDVDDFNMNKVNAVEFKNSIRGKAKLVFGFVGRFETWHGLSNVVEALSILKKEKPAIAKNIKLILVGEGTEQKALELQIEKTNIKSLIELTGWVDHQLIPRYLSCIDVALAPYIPYSKNTGSQYACPLKILEYLAADKWVITVDTLFSEIIKKLQAGYILQIVDTSELLKAFKWTWENRTNIFKNLNRSSDYIKKNYSWDLTIQKLESLMLTCIK